jgi:hypothetical protein
MIPAAFATAAMPSVPHPQLTGSMPVHTTTVSATVAPDAINPSKPTNHQPASEECSGTSRRMDASKADKHPPAHDAADAVLDAVLDALAKRTCNMCHDISAASRKRHVVALLFRISSSSAA